LIFKFKISCSSI